MCNFTYSHFASCDHTSIQLQEYCSPRLWRAGMDGQIWICPESKYLLWLMDLPGGLVWEPFSGWCQSCKMKLGIDLDIPSYIDLNASPYEPVVLTQEPYLVIPELRTTVVNLLGPSSQFLPRTGPISETQYPFTAATAKSLGGNVIKPRQLTSMDPFMFEPLILSNELKPETSAIIFPGRVAKFDRREYEGNFQWIVQGYWVGIPAVPTGPAKSQDDAGGKSDIDSQARVDGSIDSEISDPIEQSDKVASLKRWTTSTSSERSEQPDELDGFEKVVEEEELCGPPIFEHDDGYGGWAKVGPFVSRFSKTAGMTDSDLRLVGEVCLKSPEMGVELYRQEFEPRGMGWSTYREHANMLVEAAEKQLLEKRKVGRRTRM